MGKRFAIALCMVLCAPAAAANSKAGSAVSPSIMAAALKLAKITNSEAVIIGDASDDERALALVPQLQNATPELAEIEKKYPGFLIEFSRALAPVTNRSWRERLPVLWKRQAGLYAKLFDAAELETLHTFYTSVTGQKLIMGMKKTIKPTAMLAEAKASPDLQFGSASALSDIKAAVPDVVSQMDAADRDVLVKFAQSGLAPRLRSSAAQTQTIALEWMNESAPWEQDETQRLYERIVARREAKEKK